MAKLKHIAGARLTLDDGQEILLEKLGKGMFHTCYVDRLAGQVYAIIIKRPVGSDYSKEILSNCDENPHIPVVERLEDFGPADDRRMYRMPLYKPLYAQYKKVWGQLKLLIAAREEAWKAIVQEQVDTKKMRYTDIGYLVNVRTQELLSLSSGEASLVEALDILLRGASDYGSCYVFEFSKKNVAVDENGTLILLDVLFSLEAAEEIRNAQTKRARRY